MSALAGQYSASGNNLNVQAQTFLIYPIISRDTRMKNKIRGDVLKLEVDTVGCAPVTNYSFKQSPELKSILPTVHSLAALGYRFMRKFVGTGVDDQKKLFRRSEVPESVSSFIHRLSIPLLMMHDRLPGRTKIGI